MKGQMSLLDLSEKAPESQKTEQSVANFSCFATFRNGAGGVRYGECVADHHCLDCEAYNMFYAKAEDYQREGNRWGKSVALAKTFFDIPTVAEYEVEAYK